MRYYSSAALSFCEQTGLNAAVSVAYFSSDSLSSVTQALKHKWVTTNQSAAVSHLDTQLCFPFPTCTRQAKAGEFMKRVL